MTTSGSAASTTSTPLDKVMPEPHFTERHTRTVQAPIDLVWAAATALTPGEIRVAGPLMALRSLPRVLKERRLPGRGPDAASFLEVFEREGFIELSRDSVVQDGRASVVYGGAGRFWSPSDNSPLPLADPAAFEAHSGPGTVKVAFSLEVSAVGGATQVTTETRIAGTDHHARRVFGRYWLIIRGPSGLIRRSWLAAIDRRARKGTDRPTP